MSKELEALREIFNGMYNKQGFIKEFKAIERALTPPTADEVCEALSEALKQNVYYEKNVYHKQSAFLYRKEEYYNQPFLVAYKYKSGLIEMTKNILPPHLITMIGKFYESLEEEK